MISRFSWGCASNPLPPLTTSSFSTRRAPKCTFSLSCQFPKLKEWWLSSQPKSTWPLSEAGWYVFFIKSILREINLYGIVRAVRIEFHDKIISSFPYQDIHIILLHQFQHGKKHENS